MREDLFPHPSWLCVPGGSSNSHGFWGRYRGTASGGVQLQASSPFLHPLLPVLPLSSCWCPYLFPSGLPGPGCSPSLQWHFSIGLCRVKV